MKKLLAIFIALLIAASPVSAATFDVVFGSIFDIVRGSTFDVVGLGETPAPPAGNTLIDSVQYGTITLSSGETSDTATISAVDTSRSSLILTGYSIGGVGTTFAYIELTNSTTVTATRVDSSAVDAPISFAVVQWSSGVTDSVQRGLISNPSGGNSSATISAVDTSRSVVSFLGAITSNGTAAAIQNVLTRQSLSNSTTVAGRRESATGAATSSYEVIEFASGVTDSVQSVMITMTNTAINTATISSVTPGETALFFGGWSTNSSSTDLRNKSGNIYLLDATTVEAARGSNNSSMYVQAFVVDFNSSYLNSSTQNGVVNITDGNTSGTATVTSVDASKSLLTWLGSANVGATNNATFLDKPSALTLTNGTTITAQRVNNTDLASSTWSLIESN